MNRYLMETPMLDYSNAKIRQLIEKKGWKEMGEFERLKSIYLLCGMRYSSGIMWTTAFPPPGFWRMGTGSATRRERCSWRF